MKKHALSKIAQKAPLQELRYPSTCMTSKGSPEGQKEMDDVRLELDEMLADYAVRTGVTG